MSVLKTVHLLLWDTIIYTLWWKLPDQRIENMGFLASCLTIKSLQQPIVEVSNGYLENPMFLERNGRRYSISLRQSSIASHRGLHSSIIDDENMTSKSEK